MLFIPKKLYKCYLKIQEFLCKTYFAPSTRSTFKIIQNKINGIDHKGNAESVNISRIKGETIVSIKRINAIKIA
jgi:hypothetical protein